MEVRKKFCRRLALMSDEGPYLEEIRGASSFSMESHVGTAFLGRRVRW